MFPKGVKFRKILELNKKTQKSFYRLKLFEIMKKADFIIMKQFSCHRKKSTFGFPKVLTALQKVPYPRNLRQLFSDTFYVFHENFFNLPHFVSATCYLSVRLSVCLPSFFLLFIFFVSKTFNISQNIINCI